MWPLWCRRWPATIQRQSPRSVASWACSADTSTPAPRFRIAVCSMVWFLMCVRRDPFVTANRCDVPVWIGPVNRELFTFVRNEPRYRWLFLVFLQLFFSFSRFCSCGLVAISIQGEADWLAMANVSDVSGCCTVRARVNRRNAAPASSCTQYLPGHVAHVKRVERNPPVYDLSDCRL